MTLEVLNGGSSQVSGEPLYDNDLVLLREGWYPVRYLSHRTRIYRRNPKVEMLLMVLSQDRNHGRILPEAVLVRVVVAGAQVKLAYARDALGRGK